MSSLASINIKFSADMKQFSTEMQNSLREIKKFGEHLKSVGTALSIGITAPIVALGYESVAAFDKAAQASAQLEAGLKSTGSVVGYTSEQLQEMADNLQKVTLFGHDDILRGVTDSLLTFTKIQGPVFKEAQKAVLDLSTRFGTDLQSSAIQVGKALQDPIKGMTALRRVGVSFSADQIAVVKQMVDTNNLAGAQTLILKELKTEFGGSAEAAAKAGAGGFKQLKNELDDLMEGFGKIIIEALSPFAQKLKELVDYFRELSPETKKTIVILAGLSAVVGPILLGLGALATLLPTLAVGFAAITGPVGLVIIGLTAVAAVVATHWGPVKRTLVDIANYFIDLYNNSTVFRLVIEGIALSFKNLWVEVKFVFESMKSFIVYVANRIYDSFATVGKLIKAVLTFDLSGVKKALSEGFSAAGKDAESFFNGMKKNTKDAASEIQKNIGTAISNTVNGNKIEKIKIPVDSVKIKESVSSGISAGAEEGSATAVKKINEKLSELKSSLTVGPATGSMAFYDAQIAELEKWKNEIATTADQVKLAENKIAAINLVKALKFDPSSVIKIEGGFTKMQTAIAAKASGIKASMDLIKNAGIELKKNIADAMLPALTNAFDSMGQGIVGALGLATTGFQGFIGMMIQTITKLIAMMLASSISQSIAGATASGVSTGPAAIFTTPAFIATAVGGVLAAFAAIPKFETGGIVGGTSFYGDKIMARVNSGELILNQKQQQNLHGLLTPNGGATNITLGGGFVLDGHKLRLVLDRSDVRKNRIS